MTVQSSSVRALLITLVSSGIFVVTGTVTPFQNNRKVPEKTWGAFIPTFFKILQENPCLNLEMLAETRSLSRTRHKCFLDQDGGNASRIFSYLSATSPSNVSTEFGVALESFCKNFNLVLRCFIPPCEACHPVSTELQNVFQSLICDRKAGQPYKTIQALKEQMTGFADCAITFGLQTASPTGRCFKKIDENVRSDATNKSCIYAQGIYDCITAETVNCADQNLATISNFKQVVQALYRASCSKLNGTCPLESSSEEGKKTDNFIYQISAGHPLSATLQKNMEALWMFTLVLTMIYFN